MCWNVQSFIVFRFLAALGCSAGLVIPRAMVRDLADGPAAAKMFSQLMLVMGVAPIVAPMLGALVVIGGASWRVIFLAASLYGVLAVAAIWFLLPDTLPVERRTRIGVIPVIVRYGAIFRERAFLTHALIGAFTSACLFAYLAATPQIFIGHFGWSTGGYAALFGLNSFAYIGYNQLNPGLVQRFGIAPVITRCEPSCCWPPAWAGLAWPGTRWGRCALAGALLALGGRVWSVAALRHGRRALAPSGACRQRFGVARHDAIYAAARSPGFPWACWRMAPPDPWRRRCCYARPESCLQPACARA